jgi:hypothetical protein
MEMGESQSNPNEVKITQAVMTREAVSLAQLHQLLSVAGLMSGIATRHTIEDEDGEVTMTEAQIAAENTFIKCCESIDKIIDDPLRWSLNFQQQQEAVFAIRQINLLKKHTAEELPHVKHSPALYRTIDGKWMALLGDPDSPGSGVTGIGDFPQQAIDNFDAAFLGKTPSIDPKEWATELALKKNEQQAMDGGGLNDNQQSEASGALVAADSLELTGSEPGCLPIGLGEDAQAGPGADDDSAGADGAGKPA